MLPVARREERLDDVREAAGERLRPAVECGIHDDADDDRPVREVMRLDRTEHRVQRRLGEVLECHAGRHRRRFPRIVGHGTLLRTAVSTARTRG